MIKMTGIHNSASIMIDEIDETTRDQIQQFLDHPAFAQSNIVIMPDCHAGKGAVIGLTMEMNKCIIPNVIGVDIGCGVLSCCFGNIVPGLERLDERIRENIPSGFSINKDSSLYDVKLIRDILGVCDRLSLDRERVLKSVGSLGGGNHFIEAGYDSSEQLWVTVHSGSRNFGLQIANYYQNLAKENVKNIGMDDYLDLEFLHYDSKDAKHYLHDLKVAQRMAAANRSEILRRIGVILNEEPIDMIESVHNYIDDHNIIRKGAISAHLDERLLIPFNMRDGIIMGRGNGNSDYNYSAPHGAGRILSRKQAKSKLNVDEFKKDMFNAGIYTTTANENTLDEAPDAYKDMNIIIDNISDTIDILDRIIPVYNFKAS